ncbi:hypothetical protein [Campylobacter ureolyticus]|uniref:hypothetical protein n=1 Tax=Campylobacter ureolyticus TaxID=827 RepID=UPI0035D06EC9
MIHCGGYMLNDKTMLNRQKIAKDNNVAITNYGILISKIQRVLKRSIEIFNLYFFDKNISKSKLYFQTCKSKFEKN